MPASTSTRTRSRSSADGAEPLPLQTKARVAAISSTASRVCCRSGCATPVVTEPQSARACSLEPKLDCHGSRSTCRTSEVRRRARRRRREPRSAVAAREQPTRTHRGDGERSDAEPPSTAPAHDSRAGRRLGSATGHAVKSAADALAAIRADIGDCTRCKLHTLGRTPGRVRRRQPRGRPDVRRRSAGRRRRRAGHSVRRPRRAAADQDHRGDRAEARGRLHRQRDQVPAARRTATPSRTKSTRASRSCSSRSTSSSRRSSWRSASSRAQTLLRTLDPISRLRGRVFDYRGAKLIPTFHPAYLLRNPSSKREVWEDMKLVRTAAERRDVSDETQPVRRPHCARDFRCCAIRLVTSDF